MRHSPPSTFEVLQRRFRSHSLISLILLFLDYDKQHNPWNTPQSILNNVQYFIFISSTLLRIPILKNYSVAQMFVSRLAGGETNDTFRIKIKNKNDVVLRLPKASVLQQLIARESESFNVRIAAQLSLNLEVLWQDPTSGHQLTDFLKNSIPMNAQSILEHLPLVLNQLRILHHAPKNLFFHNTIDIFERNNQWLEKIKKPYSSELLDALPMLSQSMEKIKTIWFQCLLNTIPCHMDPVPSNFLLLKTQDQQWTCRLIDFEYAGNVRGGDIVDVAYFSLHLPSNMTSQLVTQYLDAPSREFESCVTIVQPVLLYWLSLWYYVNVTEQSDKTSIDKYQQDAKQFLTRTLTYINSSQFFDAINYLSDAKTNSQVLSQFAVNLT